MLPLPPIDDLIAARISAWLQDVRPMAHGEQRWLDARCGESTPPADQRLKLTRPGWPAPIFVAYYVAWTELTDGWAPLRYLTISHRATGSWRQEDYSSPTAESLVREQLTPIIAAFSPFVPPMLAVKTTAPYEFRDPARQQAYTVTQVEAWLVRHHNADDYEGNRKALPSTFVDAAGRPIVSDDLVAEPGIAVIRDKHELLPWAFFPLLASAPKVAMRVGVDERVVLLAVLAVEKAGPTSIWLVRLGTSEQTLVKLPNGITPAELGTRLDVLLLKHLGA